jgi:MFS family permease
VNPSGAVLAMLAYQGYNLAILGVAAPWLMITYGLDQRGLAWLVASVSLSALGGLALARLLDRLGRRPVVVWCLGATPICAIGAGLAGRPSTFALWGIVLYSLVGVVIASGIVLIAEQLDEAHRARGQSWGGVALGLGSGVCVALMPLLHHAGLSWRWLLFLSGAGCLLLPLVTATLRESARWEGATALTPGGATTLAIFAPGLRRRTVPLLLSAMLSAVAVTAAGTWRYFHAVSVVGLSPAAASGLLLLVSGLAMAGFPIGARVCDRAGRVPTVSVAALVMGAGIAWSFWGPPAGTTHSLLWLGLGFFGFGVASNAMTVGGNCAATELIPTTLRGTMLGWFHLVGSAGQVVAQGGVALFADRMGGISAVIGWAGLLGIGVAAIFAFLVEETRGKPLPEIPPRSEPAEA